MDEAISGDAREQESPDLWVKTVGTVAAPLLAGFSLASVIAVTDGVDHFRWPGGAVLLLTIASVLLIGAVVYARHAARGYSSHYRGWRRAVWLMYHLGITALLGGLGLALAPKNGVGTQEHLRWAASGIALVACAAEFVNSLSTAVRKLAEP